MHRYRQLHKIYTVARVIQKYFNTLFLKSSSFFASITVTGKLFHILRVEEKKDKHQGELFCE